MKSLLSLVVIIFLTTSFFPKPLKAETFAQASVSAKDAYLLEVINQLLAEVRRLQTLLKAQSQKKEEQRPYEAVFFTRPMEKLYFVDDLKLVEVNGGSIRSVDQELFDLFSDVLGSEAVERYVREWRVFNDEHSKIDAYVESTKEPNRFLVSINRHGYASNKKDVRQSYAELFIHEYAHLLFLEQKDLVEDYTKRFWTDGDFKQASKLKNLAGAKRQEQLISYYQINSDRFVSDYATLSPDEDLAETFLTFVYEEKRKSDTLRSAKINYFFVVPEFVTIRNTLRKNLEGLGLLD